MCQINQIQHGRAAAWRASNILSRLSIFSPQKMTKNFAETFRKKKKKVYFIKKRKN